MAQREILFRCKSGYGTWYYGTPLLDGPEVVRFQVSNPKYTPFVIDKPETLGQYTGLTDRNGAKIFEGDVCNLIMRNGNDIITGKVELINGAWRIGAAYIHRVIHFDTIVEIIGNIHDNPELLTK